MTTPELIAAAIVSIGALLILITLFRVHPFIALLLVSIALGIATGMPAQALVATIEAGMGKTLGHVALIIPLGAMIGKLVERSGGAAALAHTVSARVGCGSEAAAIAVAAYFIGMPVFFEVGVVLIMPVLYGMAAVSRRSLVSYSLPACVVLLIVHGILPPHPGAVTTTALLGADMGLLLAFGIPITAITALLCWPVTRRLGAPRFVISEATQMEVDQSGRNAVTTPSRATSLARQSLLLVVAPIVLILAGSLLPGRILPSTSALSSTLALVGAPAVALLAAFAAGLLQYRANGVLRQGSVQLLTGEAIESVALVILITGAGGAFAGVLVASGVGKALATAVGTLGLPILGLGFSVTLLLRIIQGPTTVALVTTAGILQPLVQASRLDANHLALLCVAMGCGGIACSHVNDAGFWMYTRFNGLSVRDGLRTWTPGTTAAGFIGLALTSLAWCLF